MGEIIQTSIHGKEERAHYLLGLRRKHFDWMEVISYLPFSLIYLSISSATYLVPKDAAAATAATTEEVASRPLS